MFQRPVSTISNKTFCCQRKHSYVAAICRFWCVCSNNEPPHPCQPSSDCHCTQPSLTPSWEEGAYSTVYISTLVRPKFSFHFVLFYLHCGQVGMSAYIWTYKCMYVCVCVCVYIICAFPLTHTHVYVFGSFEYRLRNTIIACV